MATNNQDKKKKQLRTLENIHGAMGCFLYMAFAIVCLVISACIVLLIARWLFPKKVDLFNYHLSTRTFVELKNAHKYKAAVDFYEQKEEIFTSEGDIYINMTEVFDCYKRIGEYEKAEAILRDMDSLKYLSQRQIKKLEEYPWYIDFLRFNIAKEYFNLYEEMGDIEGQKRYYALMKQYLTPEVIEQIIDMQNNLDEDDTLFLNNPMRLYDLKMLYLSSPKEAIMGTAKFLDQLYNNGLAEPTLVLKYLNLLNNWAIEQYGVLPAYQSVSEAIEYALDTDPQNDNKYEYGTLSDICYRVHDIKNSKWFYSKYTTYLEQNTTKDDPLYIENQIRGFKFLENEQNWEELESQVIECCTGLRLLLSKNIYTMSESQREHFVNLLNGPFDYANNLLYNHPSDKLAILCFDNSIFIKGLLLRSSQELANKIRNSGDESLVEKFEQLQEYRKELSYRENLDEVGNAIRIRILRKDIDNLDKQLAVSCPEYRYDREIAEANIGSISKCLDTDDAIIDFIQTGEGNLLALIATKNGKVTSVNLGTENDALRLFQTEDYWQSYTNPSLTQIIWTPIEQHLTDIKDIYYTTNGVFNSISFQALSVGSRQHLIDHYDFHLLSNASNLLAMQSSVPSNQPNKLAIWGAIDYGNKEPLVIAVDSSYRDITRGNHLNQLVFSKDEIDYIKSLIAFPELISFYSGAEATELSFRSRSGKKDNILHISTHGFFDEDDAHRKEYNPMFNSGLFFAGADSTWNRIDTVFNTESMIDDGILRASEIQYLDFSDCSLAVLSACKTGLGHSSNTEGVYGLQRAFKLAGVEKILMSLWNVDDYCTSELMQTFYYYYIKEGYSDEKALRAAQSAIREKYPNPKYWGAFVLLY